MVSCNMVWRLTERLPLLELECLGQLTHEEQPGNLQEAAPFGEVLDGITAIAQNATVAVNVGDAGLA